MRGGLPRRCHSVHRDHADSGPGNLGTWRFPWASKRHRRDLGCRCLGASESTRADEDGGERKRRRRRRGEANGQGRLSRGRRGYAVRRRRVAPAPKGELAQMTYLLGVLIFVIALLISITLHEAGHLVTAKAFGMKANKFFIGFGNTVWSTVRGETEYGIKSLPLGGFVDISGMSNLDEIDPADEARTFRSKPAWQRSVVLLAGSFMHFVIGFVLIFAVAAGLGEQNTTVVSLDQ